MNKTTNKRKYRVLSSGENFLLNMEGEARKTGFYTTRFVEAYDAEEAEAVAIDLIKSDPKLSDLVLNKRGDTPILNAEEIEEVEELQPQLGYAFYFEEEDAP